MRSPHLRFRMWGREVKPSVPPDVRDQVVDFVRRTVYSLAGVTTSKFYDWRQRYGCVNEHNGCVPRDFWLELWEKEAIIEFHLKNPLEGYRRLTLGCTYSTPSVRFSALHTLQSCGNCGKLPHNNGVRGELAVE